MTLHELAEALRKVAYDLDESNRLWDSNDRHVENLNQTIARLTTRIRIADEQLAEAKARLLRLAAKRSRRRTAAKKAKR